MIQNWNKNPQQTIKFSKKKIHIKRSTSQNPKRSRSLSNNQKISSSKNSDSSGNVKDETNDETSSIGPKKISINEMPSNWHNTATNIDKIAALASISKYCNTANFNSEDFHSWHIMRKGNPTQSTTPFMDSNGKIVRERANPVSPTTTKWMVESENVVSDVQHHKTWSTDVAGPKPSILSMTVK